MLVLTLDKVSNVLFLLRYSYQYHWIFFPMTASPRGIFRFCSLVFVLLLCWAVARYKNPLFIPGSAFFGRD